MAELTDFVALRLVLPGWPTNIVSIPPLIDYVGLADLNVSSSGMASLHATGTIQIIDEISMDLPLIPGCALVLFNNGDFTEFEFEIEYVEDWFSVSLLSLSVGIRFQSSLLKRMERVGNNYIEVPDDPVTGNPAPVEVTMDGIDISVNSKGEVGFTFQDGAPALTMLPFMIGDSGVVVDIQKLQLIFSEASSAALPATIDASWRGIFLEEATIHLPDSLAEIIPDDITFEDAFIGSGGFSGHVILDWEEEKGIHDYDETQAKSFLGFSFTLQKLNIGFTQNTLTSSSITGFLKVPFFDEAVKLDIGLANDGNFTIGVSDQDGLLILQKDGVIRVEVNSLEFIKEGNVYSVKISGELTPLLPGLDWPSFELKGLTISSDGTVKVEGGWIELPEQKALDFYSFKVEISRIGFGSDEVNNVQYNWIGFSGGIQIVQGLPLKGGVEGLKVMWDSDNNVKLKIGGVYLSFEVENVLTFDGTVNFIDEGEIKEFRGGIDLYLIPLNFGVNAQFITGSTPSYNYFYIFIDVDLPVGIPLGPPVLGLYGLSGLYGQNMSLDYQGLIEYEDVADRPDLSDVGNWFNQKDAMAFGAGLTIGTLPDVKFTAKAKVLFVILIPGPVLLIEGHAGMLSLGDNYPLHVLAVLDVATGTFLMNISATYAFPKDTGTLLDISGSAEAYFSGADPDSWHLYLGENKPESKRIRADILEFFTAQTCLMVDNNGLLMGAWIGYGLDKKYGILRVILEAWLSGELSLSTMPLQVKGSVTLYGNAELSAGIVSLGISVEANVATEAPKPLTISASLQVQLKTPLGKPKAKIKLKWEKPGVPPFPIPLSATLGIEHRKVTKNWEVAKYSIYETDSDGLYNDNTNPGKAFSSIPMVPPDVYLVLNFDKAMQDAGLVGDNPSPAPPYEKVGNYEFKYLLNEVTLEYRDQWDEVTDDGSWSDYVSFAKQQVEDDQSSYALTGNWQALPNTNSIENTRLMLNASTPYEIGRNLANSDIWWAQIDMYNPEYPCNNMPVEEKICADFEDRNLGIYYNVIVQDDFIFSSPHPMDIIRYPATWLNTEHALFNGDSYQTIECLNIKAQPVTERINLKVVSEALITAGIGYDSWIKFTTEFSKADVELQVNQSILDVGKVPAFIYFPEISFPGLPYQVWVTAIVENGDGVFLLAYDNEGNLLDQAGYSQGKKINGKLVYELRSDSLPIRRVGVIGTNIRIIEICYTKHHRVESSTILVTAPTDLYSAEVHLSRGANGTIFLYNRANTQVEAVPFDIPEDISDNDIAPVLLNIENNNFRAFLVTGQYKMIRTCGVTVEAHENYLNDAGLRNHLQTSLDENWGCHTAQILHPGKYYRLKVETATYRRKNNDDWDDRQFTEYLYFKTGNPPGPPADLQRDTADNERYDLEPPLKDLSAYISYTIPEGAAADEPQSFIYRSYDIGVVYNDSYIDQMYQMASQPLKISLIDNNNQPVKSITGEVIALQNVWGDNPTLSLTTEETHYQDVLDDSGCVVIRTSVIPESNNEIIGCSRDMLLLPRIQYKAQVIAGEDTSIYEWSFLTSRYSNFIHHIHSYHDVAWNLFELLNEPDYTIDLTVLQQVIGNGEEEQVRFEQLMELLSLNPRQLPEDLEITLLTDKSNSCGLLVESPEPLDWNRCELVVKYTAKQEAIDSYYGSVKITGGNISEATGNGDLNNQWVDLMMLESADLSGYTIEYRHINRNEDNEPFLEYFVFPSSGIYLAGTMVSVFNGQSPEEPEDTEHIRLYAAHTEHCFSDAGTRIRLKNNKGEVVHERVLYRIRAFRQLDVNVIKNSDATRFFVFIEDGSQPFSVLEAGIYQLEFTYKRDIGTDEPLLKRFGFTEPEKAIIQFSVF